MSSKNIELLKLGQKIKYRRKLANLSKRELAKLINLSVESLGRIEAGKADIKYTNLLKIVRVFGVNPTEFFKDNS